MKNTSSFPCYCHGSCCSGETKIENARDYLEHAIQMRFDMDCNISGAYRVLEAGELSKTILESANRLSETLGIADPNDEFYKEFIDFTLLAYPHIIEPHLSD